MRFRCFWAVCLGYPGIAVIVAYAFRHLASPAVPAALIVGWPLAIVALAFWITSWPCPQCGKSFFYVPSGSRDNVFTVRACGYCGLPKWADRGGTPPLPASSPVALTDARGAGGACWFCGRDRAHGPALHLHALDAGLTPRALTISRCRKCALAHALYQGYGAALLGMVAFVGIGGLFLRGLDEQAGFAAAMTRFLPFAALAFVATIAAIGVGLLLSRPVLWRSRPLDAWQDHPDVKQYIGAGWTIWYRDSAGIEVSTT